MLVHKAKKLIVMSTIDGSYLIIFPYANRVDPDQAALPPELLAQIQKNFTLGMA